MAPESLTGARRAWEGSRFWALGDDSNDNNSKQKDDESREGSYDSNKDFLRDAISTGFSLDDVLRAETLLVENFHSRKFSSVDRGAGHTSHPRPLASRIMEAVADLQTQGTMKPWKGPLPKKRSQHN